MLMFEIIYTALVRTGIKNLTLIRGENRENCKNSPALLIRGMILAFLVSIYFLDLALPPLPTLPPLIP
jgi:hypothetical protein